MHKKPLEKEIKAIILKVIGQFIKLNNMVQLDSNRISALKAVKNSNLLIKLIQESVKDSPETATELLNELGDNLESLGGIDLSQLEMLKGEDGKNPVFGEDYMTAEEIDGLEKFIEGKAEAIGAELAQRLTVSIKTAQAQINEAVGQIKNGKDGKDGKDGRSVTENDIKFVFDKYKAELIDSPLDVVEKIKKVRGTKRLGFKNVRGLPELEKKVINNADEIGDMKKDMLTELDVAVSRVEAGGGGAGEANTGTNVGGEKEVYKDKVGTSLRFRTIKAGTNITVTENADDIEIAATGGGSGETNTASNVGAGSDVFKQKTGVDLEFKTLIGGTNVTLTENADDITITATSSGGGGDMYKATYDPTTVEGDAFDMDNMVEGTSKILTTAERGEIAANTVHKTSNGTDHGYIDQDVSSGTSPTFGAANISGMTASQITDFDTEVANNAAVTANTAKNSYPSADATKLSGIETGATVGDSDAIHDNVAGEITAVTEKVTPHDDDVVLIEDSEAANVKKRVKVSALGGGGSGDMEKSTYDSANVSEQLLGEDAVQTTTNKRITQRVSTIASSATPTPAGDTTDEFTITALAANATIGAPTGTPTNGQKLIIRIDDDGTARTLAWNAIYNEISSSLPTTTVVGETIYMGFIYNTGSSKWDAFSAAQEENPTYETVSFTQELDNGSKTASFTVDFSTDQKQKATLTANTITLTLDTTDVGIGNYLLKVVNGGLATLTWASESGSINWAGGTAPALTSSGTDIVSVYFDGTDWWGMASLNFS